MPSKTNPFAHPSYIVDLKTEGGLTYIGYMNRKEEDDFTDVDNSWVVTIDAVITEIHIDLKIIPLDKAVIFKEKLKEVYPSVDVKLIDVTGRVMR